jgi:hypothetical protein
LIRGSGSGGCRGSLYITGSAATDESTAYLLGGFPFSPSERPGPGDGSARAVILWRLCLEQPQNPIHAIGGPPGDKTSVRFG